MSWGTELWDQYDNLSMHTQKGIDFLERYGHFIRDRCTIELEYASKLRRLVKNYHPKKKEEEDYQFSSCKAFKQMLNEINDLAGQHEVIAENLTATVCKEINTLVKDFKDDRKKYLQEGAKAQTGLQNQLASMDRAKKNYEKSFKEAEKALDNFQKADADLNLSRAEVEKHRMNSSMKAQHCEDSKNEYANQQQKSNELQGQHYDNVMPAVFQQLQDVDEKRIKCIQNFLRQAVEIERSVFPIIHQCLDGIVRASDEINAVEDSKLVIERYKSGFLPPSEYPFEDLSAIKNGEATPIHITTSPIKPEILTVKGTLSSGKLKKRGGLFGIFSSSKEDYADLPPNQRKKRLQQKIDEINAKIQQETAARDGLMKMKDVYEQNPALGDPMSIEGQLTENSQRLDKLRHEVQKFQALLESDMSGNYVERKNSLYHSHMNGSSPRAGSGGSGGSAGSQRNSGSDESLSRSASDLSVSNVNHKPSAPGTPLPSHGSSNSPESGIGTSSHVSNPDSDLEHHEYEGANGDYYDVDPLPPLGTCRALYAFDATSEGSIPMFEGEEMLIIEVDQGDGWTRVRRQNDTEEGFVPTTYVECHLHSS